MCTVARCLPIDLFTSIFDATTAVSALSLRFTLTVVKITQKALHFPQTTEAAETGQLERPRKVLRFVIARRHQGPFVFETLQTDSSLPQPAAARQCHYCHSTEEEIMVLYIRVAVV